MIFHIRGWVVSNPDANYASLLESAERRVPEFLYREWDANVKLSDLIIPERKEVWDKIPHREALWGIIEDYHTEGAVGWNLESRDGKFPAYEATDADLELLKIGLEACGYTIEERIERDAYEGK